MLLVFALKWCRFQPALPMRGVTAYRPTTHCKAVFQPALPMRGVTEPPQPAALTIGFQPALPMRGVTEDVG